MRTFCCQECGQPIYYENTKCTRCGALLGFLPDRMQLIRYGAQPGDPGRRLDRIGPVSWTFPGSGLASEGK